MATATRAGTRVYTGPYAAQINQAAAANALDPFQLAAVLKAESGFRPDATSQTGDVGIAQINLPSHPDVAAAQALNPAFAIPWAARYLAQLKRAAGGSWPGALRAYNTGSAAPSPAGTAYVDQVNAAYAELRGSGATGANLPAPQTVLQAAPGADLTGVDPRVLGGLYALGVASGQPITITSGRRAPSSNVGYSNDPHQRGVAVDATVNGAPIGDVFTLSQLAAVGLQGGNQPGFYNGQPDPLHVQLPGAGVNKQISYTPPASTSNASFWDRVLQVGTGVLQVAKGATGDLSGVPGGVRKVSSGLGGALNGVPFLGNLVSLDQMLGKAIGDPAYALLWLLFMALGFGLMFLGLSRLFAPARRPQPTPETITSVFGAPAGAATKLAAEAA